MGCRATASVALRFSFDTGTGQPRIAIADVGQNRFEELDYTTVAAASGANFGWDAFEGLYTDFCSGQLRSLVPQLRRASNDRRLGLSVSLVGWRSARRRRSARHVRPLGLS